MDDEEMIRMVSGEILGSLGYEVEFAKEGGEAIALYGRLGSRGAPLTRSSWTSRSPAGWAGGRPSSGCGSTIPA